MAISSQTLKEIIKSFKAQLDDRLDVFAQRLTDSLTKSLTDGLTTSLTYGLNDSFHSIQDSLKDM
jgi:hypothetical protein